MTNNDNKRMMMLVCVLIAAVKTGHIYTWDLNVIYQMEGKVSVMELPFKLTTPLFAR